jgi:hypothetical protein
MGWPEGERDHLEDIGVDGKKIWKIPLKNLSGGLGFDECGSAQGQLVVCRDSNENLVSTKFKLRNE